MSNGQMLPEGPTEQRDTEWSMVELLKKRYPHPQYAVIPQVRNAAGFDATNTADAFAMGIWPSRGLLLHGFEVKCSRPDWLGELKKPHKAEAFAGYCDHWWMVTSPGVIKEGELPEPWGHLERQGKKLIVVKEAPKNAAPRPLSRSMLAALLKRSESLPEQERADIERAGFKKGEAAAETHAGYARKRHDELRARVEAFEKASGVSLLYAWEDGGKIGKAVRNVLDGKDEAVHDRLRQLREQALRIAESIDRELGAA